MQPPPRPSAAAADPAASIPEKLRFGALASLQATVTVHCPLVFLPFVFFMLFVV
jgi:hypothetical protein